MEYVALFEATLNPRPKVMVCVCFDPRIKRPVDRFITENLGLGEGEFILKSLGGGPLTLAHPMTTGSRCKAMMKQICFAFHKFPSLEELVLIMHRGCAYYTQVPAQCSHGDKREERDLGEGASVMKGAFKKFFKEEPRVSLYVADLIHEGRDVAFYRVPTPDHAIPPPERFLARIPQLA